MRHDFTTEEGRDVGVLVYRDGRREIVAYNTDDPDACTTMVTLTSNDTQTMSELLGTSQVTESVGAVLHEIEGLGIEWLTVHTGSPAISTSIGDGAYRTRTGSSIVAVVRDDSTIPAPGPEFVFEEDDVIVAVGTLEGLAALHDLLAAS
ncbi:cation:proton antiporter regulatory subunit [Ilumatobacter coccineus]|uniref:cation:proton antiporter regulatory subunit n=1 Tax=Ilumatobacter coccineus TaxID=467094 RepID=UPI000347F1F7|nr:TrkA C-terminal domain-containing protein [Ilumatobacter coccineus]